ncbi:MAG TPA: ATP-binding protein [Candidatus Solibacter sp.]|nr:ATP-binding protein [Candidatus Solibacter sp.]
MIHSIEALSYRCLKYVKQRLGSFHLLVGPNGSGKSTFLDVISFLADLLMQGPDFAVEERASSGNRVDELVWKRETSRFELALNLRIPDQLPRLNRQHTICRYEVAIGISEQESGASLLAESLVLMGEEELPVREQRSLFPIEPVPPTSILLGAQPQRRRSRTILKKIESSSNDYFKSEMTNWNLQFRFGPSKTALANLPEDPTKFPIATWAKTALMGGIQTIALDIRRMREPSPKRSGRYLWPNGSNLASVVHRLRNRSPKLFEEWVSHVRTILPDLKAINTRDRPEDRHVYLTLAYENGVRVPSWLVSDGTLRMLALTALPYIKPHDDIYLIEEPENGVHPRAVEGVFQSLSSVYDAQVLVATHSPVLLRLAKPEQVLCFGRTPGGATDVISGSEHPRLKDWQGEVEIGDLFAAGVLG